LMHFHATILCVNPSHNPNDVMARLGQLLGYQARPSTILSWTF